MSKIEDKELEKVIGGSSTITGTVFNAFNMFIRILYDAGEAVGSSIRRIKEGSLCPLE